MRDRRFDRLAVSRVAVAVLICSLMVMAKSAMAEVVNFEDESVQVRVAVWWPRSVGNGYVPVEMALTNLTEEPVAIKLQLTLGFTEYRKEVQLAAGRTQEWSLEVPFVAGYRASVSVDVDSPASRMIRRIDGLPVDTNFAPVLVITPHRLHEQDLLLWDSLYSDQDGGSESQSGVEFFALTPEQLAPSYRSYLGFHCIVIDGTEPLTVVAAEPLLQWARLGGHLILLGSGARQRLTEWGAYEEWQDAPAATHAYGMGRITIDESTTVEQAPAGLDIPVLPANARVPAIADRLELPDFLEVDEIPRRAFTLLLVVFALVIGPINFRFLRKLGRPVLILITVPLTALVFSTGMLLYALLVQGVAIQTWSHSWTVLDQRSHVATTREARRLFAGLLLGDRWRPNASTAVTPLWGDQQWNAAAKYYVDDRGEIELAGDFLPPRQYTDQLLFYDASARQRLNITKRDDQLLVVNGLGVDVQRLVLHVQGQFYHGSSLRSGASIELDAVSSGEVSDCIEELRRNTYWEEMPASSYFAEVRENPFTDSGGLELRQVQGKHVVFGLVDVAGEEAR